MSGFPCLGCGPTLQGSLTLNTRPGMTMAPSAGGSVPNAVFIPPGATPPPAPPNPGHTLGPIIDTGTTMTPVVPPFSSADPPWYKTKLGMAAIAGTLLVGGYFLIKR